MTTSGSILGNAVTRVEDPRFLKGEGRYMDDIRDVDALSAVFVRSPFAHARITGIDTTGAEKMPGVAGVYTARNLELPGFFAAAMLAGMIPNLARAPLATDTVRFVGEIVAVVVASTRVQAVDAAEAVVVDYEPLPAVTDFERAAGPDAPVLFPAHGSNVAFAMDTGTDESVLDGADVVVKGRFENQRLAPVPMEVNGAIVVPNPETGGITLYASTQNVFGNRDDMAGSLGLSPDQVHVIAPAVGGGFGAKGSQVEHVIMAKVALELGRPVRWIETRSENLVNMTHGRAQVQHVEIGAKRDGTIVGLRAKVFQDVGAYPAFGMFLPTLTKQMACGVYAIPKVEFNFFSVLSNTTPTSAYRGAGRPEATALIERAVDMVADELGLDPADVRRKNFIPKDAFPHTTVTGAGYDIGDYELVLDEALKIAGYDELLKDQAARRERGDRVQLGLGMSVYVEITGGVPPFSEYSSVEVHTDGSVTVRTGTSPHGQGHETAWAQIASSVLGVPMDKVEVVYGDTKLVARGLGTMGSRSLQQGGTAVFQASEAVVDKAKKIAAHLLEASEDDIVVTDDGRVGVAGTPAKAMGWGELAAAAEDASKLPDGVEAGLSAVLDFQAAGPTYPFGAHVAVVEVDTETGDVTALRHIAVDDCGRVLNPLLTGGQVHGGAAQGIAQALYEGFVYDDDGNPLTATLVDYAFPSAAELPSFENVHTETPTPLNPLGAKGIGESATIGSTPAVQNAVVDAVSHLGVRHIDMPLTPERVWRAIRDAR
jgi:carbon-monoxide dehydrogenase large subunit